MQAVQPYLAEGHLKHRGCVYIYRSFSTLQNIDPSFNFLNIRRPQKACVEPLSYSSTVAHWPRQILKMPVPLFNYPREIRDRIYHFCLALHIERPSDYKRRNVLGCTNILRTSKTVYAEAIEQVYKDEVVIDVPLEGLPMFRHPLAQGFPTFFADNAGLTKPKPFLPQRFSELQFLRLRNIALVIYLPALGESEVKVSEHKRWPMTEHTIVALKRVLPGYLRELEKALRKSTHLRSLRVFIRRTRADYALTDEALDYDSQLEIHTLLPNLLATAWKKGAWVQVGRRKVYACESGHEGDYLIPNLLEGTCQRGAYAYKMIEPPIDWQKDHDRQERDLWRKMRKSETVLPQLRTDTDELTGEITFRDHPLIPKPEEVETGNEKGFKNGLTPHELVPECRKCYALFANKQGLLQHLVHKPSHKIEFRQKRLNKMVPWAMVGMPRTCKVCGCPFALYNQILDHYGKYPSHEQDSIVPMYVEDNRWWRRMCEEAEQVRDFAMVSGHMS